MFTDLTFSLVLGTFFFQLARRNGRNPYLWTVVSALSYVIPGFIWDFLAPHDTLREAGIAFARRTFAPIPIAAVLGFLQGAAGFLLGCILPLIYYFTVLRKPDQTDG